MKATEEEAIQQLIEKVRPFKKPNIGERDITVELLEEGRMISARLIDLYGDVYLPIFIRLQNEIEQKKNELHYRKMALQLLKNDS